jgi:hypothetical protein
MNKEDIIRMAREAALYQHLLDNLHGVSQWVGVHDMLERFAALVAEDCAKVADQAEPYQSADLIRARWQA